MSCRHHDRTHPDWLCLEQPTILRVAGFEVVIRTTDHEPAHVHVLKGGGEVQIRLRPVRVGGRWRMGLRDVAQARDLVLAHQSRLIKAWEAIHGQTRA